MFGRPILRHCRERSTLMMKRWLLLASMSVALTVFGCGPPGTS